MFIELMVLHTIYHPHLLEGNKQAKQLKPQISGGRERGASGRLMIPASSQRDSEPETVVMQQTRNRRKLLCCLNILVKMWRQLYREPAASREESFLWAELAFIWNCRQEIEKRSITGLCRDTELPLPSLQLRGGAVGTEGGDAGGGFSKTWAGSSCGGLCLSVVGCARLPLAGQQVFGLEVEHVSVRLSLFALAVHVPLGVLHHLLRLFHHLAQEKHTEPASASGSV